jgi:RNA polymerase sigma-70 factor (sigma-E family)
MTMGAVTVTFEDFLRAELTGLTRFAGALTGDRHLAEDVLADALLVAAGRWRRIAGMAHPAAFVRRIVVTTFLSDRRRAARRRTDPTGDATVLDRPSADASAATADRDEVDRLLARLPAQQRAAVVLRYLYDLPDTQIGEALGCSPATARSHLSHARTALRLSVADSVKRR